MEHDQQQFGDESVQDPYQLAEYQSEFDLDLNQALQIDPDDAEELDVQEFRRLMEKFNENPIDFVNSDPVVTAKFIQWINYPGADEYLNDYGILQRYDNELDHRIWIQRTEYDFTKKSKFDVDNFRYMNCGKPREPAKFLAKFNFLVNYWQIKEQPTIKLRKYYHPDLPFAVIVQYEEIEPPKKRQRTAQPEPPKNQSPTYVVPNPVSYSSDSLPDVASQSSSTSSPNSHYNSNQISPQSVRYMTPSNNYSPGWIANNYSNNANTVNYYQGSDTALQTSAYMSDGYQSPLQTNSSQISNGSPDSNSTNLDDPYVLKEEYIQQQQVIHSKIEQISYDVQQTKKDVSMLSQSLTNLSITVSSHDAMLERHENEIAELSINVNREICTALLTVFKQQSGYAPVGKALTKLLRSADFLNRTPQQLPDATISKFVYVLVDRKIIYPRSSTDTRWELNVEMAKKYGLLK